MRANGNALHLRALSIAKRIAWKICYFMCFLGVLKGFSDFQRSAVGRCLELFRLNTDDSRN